MRLSATILGVIGAVFGGLIAAMGLGAFGSYWAYGAAEGDEAIWVASFAATAMAAAVVALVAAVLPLWWPRPAGALLAASALLGLPAGGTLWLLPFLLLLAAAALAWSAERGGPRPLTHAARTSLRVGALALGLLGAAAGMGSTLLEFGVFGPEYVGGGPHALEPLWHDILVGSAFALALGAVMAAVLALSRPTLSAALLAGIAVLGFPAAAGTRYFWEMTDRWHFAATWLLFAVVLAVLGRGPRREAEPAPETVSPAVTAAGPPAAV